MKDKIQLKYVARGKCYIGEIEREEIFNWMKEISEKFKDNEVSTKLVKLIPNMVKMQINKDINETKDVPFITYENGNGEELVVNIMRNHHIIWGFLDHYCDEVMK